MKNKTKSRIPHTRTRSRLGTPEYLAAHSFKDKRSYVTAFGRKVLRGKDMTDLRMKVFRRSGGHCEEVKNGNPHGKYAPWDGIGKGELSHLVHRGRGGSDEESNVIWSCADCHRARHPGVQWTPKPSEAVA